MKIKGGIPLKELKRLKEKGNLICIPNEDGVFEEYKDDYDVTLHFRTLEEQKEFFEKFGEMFRNPDDTRVYSLKALKEAIESTGSGKVQYCFTHFDYPGIEFFYGVREETHEDYLGTWKQEGILPEVYAECSECGYEIYSEKEKTNFCPSCGAKMNEEAEG